MTSFYEYRRKQRIKAEEEQDKKNLEKVFFETPDFYMMRNSSDVNDEVKNNYDRIHTRPMETC